MTLSSWESPEVGVYYRQHAGHNLEIRRRKLGSKDRQLDKLYKVIIDGVQVAAAWNTYAASNMAIRIAEKIESTQTTSTMTAEMQAAEAASQTRTMAGSETIGLSPGYNPEDILAPQTGGCSGSVSFSITGIVEGMSPADALGTIRSVVEILRQHASVKCSVVLPNTIDL